MNWSAKPKPREPEPDPREFFPDPDFERLLAERKAHGQTLLAMDVVRGGYLVTMAETSKLHRSDGRRAA